MWLQKRQKDSVEEATALMQQSVQLLQDEFSKQLDPTIPTEAIVMERLRSAVWDLYGNCHHLMQAVEESTRLPRFNETGERMLQPETTTKDDVVVKMMDYRD